MTAPLQHARPWHALLLWLTLLAGPASAAENPANPLITDRGLFRPLIIVAPDGEAPDYRRLRDGLSQRHTAAEARKMLLYTVVEGAGQRAGKPMTDTETRALLEALEVPATAPLTVILVGLDGGKKMQLEGYVAPRQVFEIIDNMPLRRRESQP
ncbi:DUF4174 domain-containing protein [Modicisalibacter coralii]|uniref:DUF4174 domain-containing protein n=1 Tax=Modicisalibacter coralii TaxID=2304602 RepID=UPI00100A52E5|nr:DUF4174 domain-containing protein [Halomonas coralii]